MKIRNKLNVLLNENETASSRVLNIFIQLLIVLSLVSFTLETVPEYSMQYASEFRLLEIIFVVLFSLEYLLRMFAAKKPFRYIFSFYGIVDLLSVLPFYLAMGIDLRSIRSVRLMRIFRLLKLLKYDRVIKRFLRAFYIIREELVLFSTFSLIMLYLSAVGIYYFEREVQPETYKSIFHSLWWATTTLTTVGYGDMFPLTLGGRLFTFFVLIIGLGIISVPTGLIASALSQARNEELKEKKQNELED